MKRRDASAGKKWKLSCNLTAVGTGDLDDDDLTALALPECVKVVVSDAKSGAVIFEGEAEYGFAKKSGNVNYFVGGSKEL